MIGIAWLDSCQVWVNILPHPFHVQAQQTTLPFLFFTSDLYPSPWVSETRTKNTLRKMIVLEVLNSPTSTGSNIEAPRQLITWKVHPSDSTKCQPRETPRVQLRSISSPQMTNLTFYLMLIPAYAGSNLRATGCHLNLPERNLNGHLNPAS